MLKEFLIDGADFLARVLKSVAGKSLGWSKWWADCAESIETGSTISDIRKQREAGHD